MNTLPQTLRPAYVFTLPADANRRVDAPVTWLTRYPIWHGTSQEAGEATGEAQGA
jgi:hypothetical protein